MFYDLLTETGNVTINIKNIASIEDTRFYTKIILNITDEKGSYICYKTKLSWSTVASDVTTLSKKQI